MKKPLQLASAERVPGAEPAAEPSAADFRGRIAAGFEYRETRVIAGDARALARRRVLVGLDQDAATRAYKVLRTQVLHKLVARDWQTIAVVSPAAGDGKTLTAINLALSLASTQSHTALLVDLDWHQPSVHSYFDYRPEHDVCSYLRGDQPLGAVLVNPGVPRFCFLPCGQPVADSSEQLLGLGGFVRELKGRYRNRIVLFDLPPLFATDDAMGFLPLADCVLLVVEEGKTRREDIARSVTLIGEDRLLGAVVNKSRQVLPGY